VEAIDGLKPIDSKDYAGTMSRRWYEYAKRVMDLSISSILLLILLPAFVPISLAILLDSKGSVFYRRRVVGRDGKPFYALKLRTMKNGSDKRVMEDNQLAEEYSNNHKLRHDPRITRVGHLLRKSSVDELPQLINVLKGEMSLVGPRMISFPELQKFGEWQDKILCVKPGITGLWQVSGRSNLDYEDRVRLNVYYVDHQSILLDLKILAKTIPTVITMRGAG
jgi:lipopolysaccharide/colanic/teichoic acid biosynthesis glycosyltransferase